MKKISLYGMVLFYVIAGINHFVNPLFYKKIMPPWIPWHYTWIYITGVAELLFGILLIPLASRPMAAWCIIALLVMIFPANIQMMLNYMHTHDPDLWISIVRLPFQFLFIWWAYTLTKSKNELSPI